MRYPLLLLALLAARPALAAEAENAPLSLHALVDVDGALNANRPPSHESFFAGQGTAAKRAGELSLEAAALELTHPTDPVGLHLTVAFGAGMEVLRGGEPEGAGIGPAVLRHVYQASLSYQAPLGRGLLLEAGIYPSSTGLEAFFTRDNWSYTRGWLAELSPYSEAGVKATYAFTDALSAQLHLLNGFGLVGDDNRAKTLGTVLAYAAGPATLSFNTLLGPELPHDDTHWRFFGDLIGTLSLTERLSLATELDAGRQQRPGGGDDDWQGVALFARFAFSARAALAGRAELFHDPGAVVAGVGQTLTEGTATLELRPVPALVFKLEGRYDHSSARVFDTRTGPGQHQALVVAGAVAQY